LCSFVSFEPLHYSYIIFYYRIVAKEESDKQKQDFFRSLKDMRRSEWKRKTGNGQDLKDITEDENLVDQFETLVSAAHVKGFTEEEIAAGLFSLTVNGLITNGLKGCCVMKILQDFVSSYYDFWHAQMEEG